MTAFQGALADTDETDSVVTKSEAGFPFGIYISAVVTKCVVNCGFGVYAVVTNVTAGGMFGIYAVVTKCRVGAAFDIYVAAMVLMFMRATINAHSDLSRSAHANLIGGLRSIHHKSARRRFSTSGICISLQADSMR